MKRFVCIFGTNYVGTSHSLNGCVADAQYWASYAKQKNLDDISVHLNDQCNKDQMIDALNSILSKAQPDDLVVYCYSGHGTTVPRSSQSLVPNNFDWNNPNTWLTYETLDQILLPHEIRGVKIVAIHDSCESSANPLIGFRGLANPLFPTKIRFLEPPQYIKDRLLTDSINKSLLNSHRFALLLAGCGKTQTSSDAFIDGGYHGAFTYSLSVALQQNPSLNYFDAVLAARQWLAAQSYDQVPTALGDDLFKLRSFFE